MFLVAAHWDSLVSYAPEDTSEEAVPGGNKAWNKATGLPLVRAFFITMRGGKEYSDEEISARKQYFTNVAQGIFYAVSPYVEGSKEIPLTYNKWREAIGKAKGSETAGSALERGLGVLLATDNKGLISKVASYADMESAARALSPVQREYLAQIAVLVCGPAMLNDARESVEADKRRIREEIAEAEQRERERNADRQERQTA